jgi:hypothetical protein
MSRLHSIHSLKAPILLSSALFLAGCGASPEFAGSEGGFRPSQKPKNGDATSQTVDPSSSGDNASNNQSGDVVVPNDFTGAMLWSWNCQTNGDNVKPTHDEAHLTDGGEFKVKAVPGGIKLRTAGNVCEPEVEPRDVMFMIDVSESNNDNDPFVGGSCGRFKALSVFLNSLPGGNDTRVALVTFNDYVMTKSPTFLTPADFKSQYLNTSILCDASGATSYRAPMRVARDLFDVSKGKVRPTAIKRLFFVTDGEPISEEVNGVKESATVRNTHKTQIYTFMLGSNYQGSKLLREKIASIDSKTNKALHYDIVSASDLSVKLNENIHQKVVGGKITLASLTQEANGQTHGYEFILKDLAQTGRFDLELGVISQDFFPDGVEFKLDYWTNVQKHYGGKGTLVWE